jgi:hypothetical protein
MSRILLLDKCAKRMREIIELSGQEPNKQMVMALSLVIMEGDIVIMHSDTRKMNIIHLDK